MTEPVTNAGKALRKIWSLDGGTERQLTDAIVAVEREAAELPVERLAEAIESLAHGRCCWDPKEDAAAILKALGR